MIKLLALPVKSIEVITDYYIIVRKRTKYLQRFLNYNLKVRDSKIGILNRTFSAEDFIFSI